MKQWLKPEIEESRLAWRSRVTFARAEFDLGLKVRDKGRFRERQVALIPRRSEICREELLMTYIDRDYDFIAYPPYAPPNLGTWTMAIGWILIAFGLAYYWAHISLG